jgi:hypothetical protein
MAAHAARGELAASAIPIRLMQKRDAVSVDQIFPALGGASRVFLSLGIEWVGHRESVAFRGCGFGAVAHGQR